MKVAHYSIKCSEIINSQELFMKKLKDCKGQDDFCLTFDQFIEVLKKLDLDKINYNKLLTREKFEKIINCRSIVDKFSNLDERIFGFCLTINPPSNEFIDKYGREYIEFDLEDILRMNTGFLFYYRVFYSLDDVESYLYDLCNKIYEDGEIKTEYALDLPNKDQLFNYNYIFARLYYYTKILYKKSNMSFEKEIRVFLDDYKIKSGVEELFIGPGYNYGKLINQNDCKNYIIEPNRDRPFYSLKLDSIRMEKKYFA